MADTDQTEKRSVFAVAGSKGGRARIEGLRRLAEVERRIDPKGIMTPRERRELARLHLEIADRERALDELESLFLERRRQELDERVQQLQELQALVA